MILMNALKEYVKSKRVVVLSQSIKDPDLK